MSTLKDLLTSLIGTDNSYVDSSGTFIPDYAFIITGILFVVFTYIFIKGIFALCKR